MTSMILQDLNRFGPEVSPSESMSLAQAQQYVHDFTHAHGENFSVISFLVRKDVRQDFEAVYAFCRASDDLGDEVGDTQQSLSLLTWWRNELKQCIQGQPRHPIYVALAKTIERHDLSEQLFHDLLDAFVQDQTVQRYNDWEQLLGYCRRSADPVGRLVLLMLGYRDEAMLELSDATCSALQLVNFWQDVRRDILERDRVYIPRDIAQQHGLDVEQLAEAIKAHEADNANAITPELRQQASATIKALMKPTEALFSKGHLLWPKLHRRDRALIRCFSLGGETVGKKIAQQRYDTVLRRPRMSQWDKGRLLMMVAMQTVAGRLWAR